jgi:hypothetical protein
MIGYEDLTWTGDRLRNGRRTRCAGFLQTDNPLSLAGQQGGRHCAECPAANGAAAGPGVRRLCRSGPS